MNEGVGLLSDYYRESDRTWFLSSFLGNKTPDKSAHDASQDRLVQGDSNMVVDD